MPIQECVAPTMANPRAAIRGQQPMPRQDATGSYQAAAREFMNTVIAHNAATRACTAMPRSGYLTGPTPRRCEYLLATAGRQCYQ